MKPTIKTFGELKKAGYSYVSIKDELRNNLLERLKNKDQSFLRIWGYENTVIPELERAILSKHNINLLGLRGQAKTRLARSMTQLLDEWVPVVAGSVLNDDPFAPISSFAIEQLKAKGDKCEIDWLHRDERYAEKLATPDVSIADLIGDIDPIKAANLKLSYADEGAIHYGLIPRSNRGIFVINELPDLQARIQVALFNILQEGDIQIRGFKLRIPLDIQFVFTANPEDYTNRGSIVTPLKDRIGSQIITHYPKEREIAKSITLQEAKLSDAQTQRIHIPDLALDLLEQISIEARDSEYIDSKSGVSARLSISALENLMSSAERRMLLSSDTNATLRVSDFQSIIPAITGKVELVYEGEQEGAHIVALKLLSKAVKTIFSEHFPDPEKLKKKGADNPFESIEVWFNEHELEILNDSSNAIYEEALKAVEGLYDYIHEGKVSKKDQYFMMEFMLHGLAEFSRLSKRNLMNGIGFNDIMSSFFSFENED